MKSADGATVEGAWSGDSLDLAKKDLDRERKKRISLERECAVYQAQLEVSNSTSAKHGNSLHA
jgi:hypothetical protein